MNIDFLKFTTETALQLPAKVITFAVIALLALLTLISFNMAAYQIQAYRIVQKIRAEYIQVTTTFRNIAKKNPLLASDTPLIVQVGALEKELHEKQTNYSTITRAPLRYGFSNYLETLAKVTPEGVWFNHIIINQDSKRAELSGYMMEPVDISLLLQALQKTPTFKNTTFNLFYVKSLPEKSYTQFNITNKPK